jgi:limonene-1,2-epoxide hydrolase
MAGSRADIIRRLIKLFEAMNVDEAIKMFTEDCSYRFGNYPAARGREGVRQSATSTHLTAIKGVAFDIKGIWESGDVLVCEMEINYTKTDDSILTLPCTDVFRMEGNLIKDMRIYMDPSPLYAKQ